RLLSPRLPATRSISPSLSISQGKIKFHHPFLSVSIFFVNFPLLLMNASMPPHSSESSRSLSPSLSISNHSALVTKPANESSGATVDVTSLNFPVLSFSNKYDCGTCPYSQGTARPPRNRSTKPSPLKS